MTATATDTAGNVSTCRFTVTVKDTEPPVVTAPPNVVTEATNPAGAVVSDALLGTAAATDNAPGVTVFRSGVPSGNVFPLGITTVLYTATDGAGNTAVAGQSVGVRDTTPPTITISSPSTGAYTLHQKVASSYACADTASPVTGCVGPVTSGSDIDTSSAGTKAFTVNAVDGTGNMATKSVSYSVGYGVCLQYDPNRAKRSGGTISLRIQLCDATATNVSAPSLIVTALNVLKISDATTTDVIDTGTPTPTVTSASTPPWAEPGVTSST